SMRGEVERNLLKTSASEIDLDTNPNARLVSIVAQNATPRQKEDQRAQLAAIRDEIAGVVKKWTDADAAAVEIKPDPRGKLEGEALVASQRHGRELFYGTVANCVKCHGDSALGDGTLTDYDDWA